MNNNIKSVEDDQDKEKYQEHHSLSKDKGLVFKYCYTFQLLHVYPPHLGRNKVSSSIAQDTSTVESARSPKTPLKLNYASFGIKFIELRYREKSIVLLCDSEKILNNRIWMFICYNLQFK